MSSSSARNTQQNQEDIKKTSYSTFYGGKIGLGAGQWVRDKTKTKNVNKKKQKTKDQLMNTFLFSINLDSTFYSTIYSKINIIKIKYRKEIFS